MFQFVIKVLAQGRIVLVQDKGLVIWATYQVQEPKDIIEKYIPV